MAELVDAPDSKSSHYYDLKLIEANSTAKNYS